MILVHMGEQQQQKATCPVCRTVLSLNFNNKLPVHSAPVTNKLCYGSYMPLFEITKKSGRKKTEVGNIFFMPAITYEEYAAEFKEEIENDAIDCCNCNQCLEERKKKKAKKMQVYDE
jgi:hypothetical protein